MSARYSLRQTPRKKELFEGMIETPIPMRRTSRRQSSLPPDSIDADQDTAELKPRPRVSRQSTPATIAEDLDATTEKTMKKAAQANGNGVATGLTNGHANGHASGHANGLANGYGTVSAKDVTDGVPTDPHVVDGWKPGQDPKVDYSGEFEFGGSIGTGFLMLFFPLLMWYMWIGATYYDGRVPTRLPGQSWTDFGAHLVDLVYTGAFPHAKAWFWYWSYMVFQVVCYYYLPGVTGYGKPLPHEGGKQLPYFCNAFVTLYFTMGVMGVLHFTGIFPIYTTLDEFGPLLSVAICSGFIVSFVAYFSAIARGRQHRMTGYPIYDFFMGAELNPRLFGIIDFKMFFEIRMPWFFLLILSCGAAARQYERYGYVSGEVWFLVMAHYLYANACAKGEELIITTWDMYYEKWGFMLIFWNLAGVPLSYCHCTIYLANHHPSEYKWNPYLLTLMFAAYLFFYWVWDSCNSQKNRFRAQEKGKLVIRNTFPQVPWQTIKDPKVIRTPQGTILIDGWYGYARKIHYTCDMWFSFSWGLITGFQSPFPWFYPVFFACMIAHRAWRDIHRCRTKYGDAWLEYERRVPYLFIPYVI